jgi:arylsulfatase A-like enzyme/tetratricopeptide (TPR) repeat protein
VRQICLTFVLAASGTLAIVSCASRAPADLTQLADRNVLLVTIDTLRADALGVDGGPARTPNIDALASGGLHFTFAHAQAVLTLPSHATILTGRHPFQHGYRANMGYRLTPGTATLATLLKAQGFATGAFVGAFPLDARFGLTPGFDVYDGRFDDSGGGAEFLLPERPAPAVVARANAWIAAQNARWFAWVHVYDPHAPYRPPPPFDAEYAGRPYYGEVAAVDRALGPLFDAARASGRPTLVVLTGDHGEGLGEHGEATHGLFAYESTLRVPLIVADIAPCAGCLLPSVPPDPAPARHIDIVPTVLDALQIAAPADLPGHSLRTRADRAGAADRPSYFEAMSTLIEYGWAPLTGVLAGRDKYIDLPIPEMYDLARDPHETQNLPRGTGGSADRAAALRTQLAAFAATRPGAAAPEARGVAERLRSLGYVGGVAPAKSRYTERDDPKRLVDLDQRMHKAVALDAEGRLPEAIVEYRTVLAERPDMLAASRHLAFDYWRMGAAAAAIDTLRAAERAGGTTPGEQVQLGAYLTDIRQLNEALAVLQQAATASPDLDALNALGLAYARNGRDTEALATFGRAWQIDPANTGTNENIGAVHLDAGRLREARESFERALATDPGAPQAHTGLAMVAMKTGDVKTAIDRWKLALARQPDNYDVLYDLGVQLARANRNEEARAYLERFVKGAPSGRWQREQQNAAAILARMPRR